MVINSGHALSTREGLGRVTTSLNCTRPFCVHAAVCIDHKITKSHILSPHSMLLYKTAGQDYILCPPGLIPSASRSAEYSYDRKPRRISSREMRPSMFTSRISKI